MINQRLEYLVKNYFDNTLTSEEEEELLELMTSKSDPDTLAQFDVLYDQYHNSYFFDDLKKQKSWQTIRSKVHLVRKNNTRPLWYAVGCIALLLCVGLYLWKTPFNLSYNDHLVQNHIYLKDEKGMISALSSTGGDTLQLPNEKLAEFGIQKDEFGNITILSTSFTSLDNTILTIASSSSQVQRITLPDGTKIWINSNSKIIFPRHFRKDKREVQLIGEAYFEVAKVKNTPFIVNTSSTTTEVLGTHFNISSYPNTPSAITLLEGKVKVYDASNSVVLEPGQQAYFKANKLDKKTIDTTDILAWQEGYFLFDNINIEELIAQIQEWYDIKYVNIKVNTDDRFSGTYKRTDRLDELLNNLEQVSNLHFEIKGGGINVLNK